jgi:hypothetical protein
MRMIAHPNFLENAVKRKFNFGEGREDEIRRQFWFIRGPNRAGDGAPCGRGRLWHRNGEILHCPHARRICASVKDYAASVASGSKRK